ncbi:MAG TPA: hypothetical protein VH500_19380 [Nitrososphaeraceae archaeon]
MMIEHLPLDEETYRKITRISYSEHIPLEKLINDMLKEYLNVYFLSKKIGYALISKEVLKITFENTPEKQVAELSKNIANRYKEAAILLNGKPTLEVYFSLIKSFVSANGYYIEFSKKSTAVEHVEGQDRQIRQESPQQQVGNNNKSDIHNKNKSSIHDFEVMIIQFNISYKFSQFLGNVYRILLEEFCTINRFELTERLVLYEYARK